MLGDWLEQSIAEGIVREHSGFMGLHIFGVEIAAGRIGNITLQNLGRRENGDFVLGRSHSELKISQTMNEAIIILLRYYDFDLQNNNS